MYKDASTLERLREKLENTFMPKFEDLRASRASRPSIGKTVAWGVPGALMLGGAARRLPYSFKRLNKFLGPEVAKRIRQHGSVHQSDKWVLKNLPAYVDDDVLPKWVPEKVKTVLRSKVKGLRKAYMNKDLKETDRQFFDLFADVG